MEMFPVCEIARSQGIEQVIYNRGVSGLNTDEFLENIDEQIDTTLRYAMVNQNNVKLSHRKYIS